MQIVVFSYNFLPMDDAEAYCTARFTNALAEAGHAVHVITMQHATCVPLDVINEILSANIRITNVTKTVAHRPILSRLQYGTSEWNSVDLSNCIRVVKDVLKQYDHPILITRSNPTASNIVGWHCRKDAFKWVAHFSDPFPWFHASWPLNWANNRWCRRFMNDADICSVTCPDVLHFFNAFDPFVFQKNQSKFVLVPHIGDPILTPYNKLINIPLRTQHSTM